MTMMHLIEAIWAAKLLLRFMKFASNQKQHAIENESSLFSQIISAWNQFVENIRNSIHTLVILPVESTVALFNVYGAS